MKKRFFFLFLCVVFTTSALLIPAAAADANGNDQKFYGATILPEISITDWFESSGLFFSYVHPDLVPLSSFEFGETYIVVFDDVEYECICASLASTGAFYPVLGNPFILLKELSKPSFFLKDGSNFYGNNEPFAFSFADEGAFVLAVNDNQPHTLAIYRDYSSGNVLPSLMEEVQLSEVLLEIVHLLPVVLVCLVGFIGLRKGIIFLIRFLQKS